jgi:hypothetical protein
VGGATVGTAPAMERAHTIVMGIVKNMSLVFVNLEEEYKEERSNITRL